MKHFSAHSKPILGLAFSPDGKSLVTSSADGSVRLWSLETMTKLDEWVGSDFNAPVAFSPDGDFIACGGRGTRVWNVRTGAKLAINGLSCDSVAFSPDGSVFAGHRDAADGLGRWRMPTGDPLPGGWGGSRTSTGAARFPTGGMAFSPDGSMLATTFGELIPGRYASAIYLWDARTGKSIGNMQVSVYAEHPTELQFSNDCRLLAGVSGHLLRVWDVERQAEIQTLAGAGRKHFKSLVFSADDRHLLTVGQDSMAWRWDSSSWKVVESLECGVGKVTKISRIGSVVGRQTLAAGGASGRVAIWTV